TTLPLERATGCRRRAMCRTDLGGRSGLISWKARSPQSAASLRAPGVLGGCPITWANGNKSARASGGHRRGPERGSQSQRGAGLDGARRDDVGFGVPVTRLCAREIGPIGFEVAVADLALQGAGAAVRKVNRVHPIGQVAQHLGGLRSVLQHPPGAHADQGCLQYQQDRPVEEHPCAFLESPCRPVDDLSDLYFAIMHTLSHADAHISLSTMS